MACYYVFVFASVMLSASALNISTGQSSVTIPFGQSRGLNCSAASDANALPLTLSWTTSASIPLARVLTQLAPNASISDTLMLTSVNSSYRGVYVCTVNDSTGTGLNSSIAVNVTVPAPNPNVTILPGQLAVGMNATLTCNPRDGVGGATVQSYRWIKDGRVLLESTASTLTITSVIMANQGSYRCNVTNVDNVTVASSPVFLTITGPSFVTPLNLSTSLKASSLLVLVCIVKNPSGSPKLVASWISPQDYNNSRVGRSNVELADGTFRSTLTVTNVNSSDAGFYSCSFTNMNLNSTLTNSTIVSVLYPPKISAFNSTPIVIAPSNLTLQCDVASNTSLPVSFNITRTSNGGTVQLFSPTITNASYVRQSFRYGPSQSSISGTYRCSVNNSVGTDSKELQIIVKDKPQPVNASTISHQYVSLSTVLIIWEQPLDNNDIITNYTVKICPSAGQKNLPCSTDVRVKTESALITLNGSNLTYVASIRAYNSIGGSDGSMYYFRSPRAELAAPTKFELVHPLNGGSLLSWRLSDLGDPSLHPEVTIANFTLCYTAMLTPNCSVVPFADDFYAQKQALGAVLQGLSPGRTYNVTITTAYFIPAMLSAPAALQITVPFPAAERSQDHYIFQNISGQFAAWLTWKGLMVPKALTFVDLYIVCYAALSKDGLSFESYINFTTSGSFTLIDVKLNTKYSVIVLAQLRTLSGVQLVPLLNNTIDTTFGGFNAGPSQFQIPPRERSIFISIGIVVAAVVSILLILICILCVKLHQRLDHASRSILSTTPDRITVSNQLSIPMAECAAYISTSQRTAKNNLSVYERPSSILSTSPNNRESMIQHVYDLVNESTTTTNSYA